MYVCIYLSIYIHIFIQFIEKAGRWSASVGRPRISNHEQWLQFRPRLAQENCNSEVFEVQNCNSEVLEIDFLSKMPKVAGIQARAGREPRVRHREGWQVPLKTAGTPILHVGF